MQYLSQRLAAKSARRQGGEPPRGAFAATQRERILAATEQLIAEKGSGGTTVEGIAKLSGVSTVTFYEHFENKQECFVAAFDRAVGETRAKLAEAAPAGLPWADRVRATVRALLEAIAAEPARARMCLVEAQKDGPALLSRYDAMLDGVVSELRAGRGLESAPADLPETLEEATAGGLAWLLRERIELAGEVDAEDLYPRIVEIVLSPYLGEGEAAIVAAGPAGDG